MSLIKLEKVNKSYLNKTFDLEIKNKDQLLIVGKNGSGKSTLVKLITKYIKPSSGLIKTNISKISYLEEQISLPNHLIVKDYLNIIENIKKSPLNYYLINEFKIPLDKKINELSKGNKQKLAIITAFTGNSCLVVLDEPLNGLDDEAIEIFLNYIESYDQALIIITHYLNLYEHLNLKVISL